MRTITIEVKNNNALKLLQDLELNKVLRIVKDDAIDSYALQGEEMSIINFKKWVNNAENDTFTSLTEAKSKWELKKKQLQNLTK
ncbi:MAG: hypothetical protein NTZ33_04350 [Bacteroidetes bacterium]|nr:hypothetical protein [Bacteroidota bacterium]